MLFAALSLAACAGSDKGRLKPASNVATIDAGDSCAAADALTFQNIMNFEPAAGPYLHHAGCDPVVDSAKGECTYLNFDSALTPRPCAAPAPSLTTCRQANGEAVADSFCSSVVTGDAAITAGDPNLPLSPIPNGRCGTSANAFHFSGTNVAACYSSTTQRQGWGATVQITFNASTMNSGMSTAAFDASSWDGISFWQRRGAGPSGRAFLFSIQDPYSAAAPATFMHPATCPKGTASADCFVQCSSEDGVPDAEKCDAFGLGVGVADDWELVKVPFDLAQQKGFGLPSPLGHLDTAALLGIQFALSAGDWDLWIDDIAFYRETSQP